MDFSEDKTLMWLPGGEWKVGDAMRGVAIFGGTGSGKTSGSGRTLALKYLAEGWGGLVLCVKTDEAELWEKYCAEAGRKEDVIIFRDGAVYKDGEFKKQLMVFNPIDYEMKRIGKGAGDPQNITNIFMNIYRMGNRITGGGENREERFWDSALKRCISRVVELLILAKEDLSFENMRRVLNTCKELNPIEIDNNKTGQKEIVSLIELFDIAIKKIEEDSKEYDYHGNYCFECLLSAYIKTDTEDLANRQSFNLVYGYFLSEFGSMGSRVRSTITESFMGLAEPFLSGLLFRHFAGVTNLFPEIIYTEKKIIILDFSVKEYLDAGIIAQSIYKMMFQQAVERRDVKEHPTPVFLWADEAQMFVNPYDQIFLTTARSKRVATVFLTQNIPNYLVVIGGSDAKPKVDSLLGNLSTKIFHANMDAETNEYASRLIGQGLFGMTSESKSQVVGHMESKTVGVSMQLRPQVLPLEFLRLKTGGVGYPDKRDDYMVDAFITSLGKDWKWEEENEGKTTPTISWRNYTIATFDQRFKLNKS